ncbi:Desumoylating isopeptidase 1 [Smittium mucronatum]|uniref:Desumoylating isopeptidase 1 n=1 Tax=Smittium mucronatum TaxID=133383 RepID=A0A1R0H6G5_9FUNG|nr:Desumoylating isopeptidase 1 [Smittium mucronatum]OLY84784.1 Desumoylating isopeptidase 1 [Smittium mucronatum]
MSNKSSTVKVYVYDLSGGLANQFSKAFLGSQIDGIWHTSVVVYGKEYYFGTGISISKPGFSQHGQPMEIIDMGTTDIPEDDFNELLDELMIHWT